MASRRAQRRKEAQTCARKTHHATQAEADKTVSAHRRLHPLTARGLEAYPCPNGDGWLIGHHPGIHTQAVRDRKRTGRRTM